MLEDSSPFRYGAKHLMEGMDVKVVEMRWVAFLVTAYDSCIKVVIWMFCKDDVVVSSHWRVFVVWIECVVKGGIVMGSR